MPEYKMRTKKEVDFYTEMMKLNETRVGKSVLKPNKDGEGFSEINNSQVLTYAVIFMTYVIKHKDKDIFSLVTLDMVNSINTYLTVSYTEMERLKNFLAK